MDALKKTQGMLMKKNTLYTLGCISTTLFMALSTALYADEAAKPAEPAKTEAATPAENFDGMYEVINPAQETTDKSKVEVTELFLYTCPHCYHFETALADWKKSKADYINYVKQPAVFGNANILHAKAFYTAEALNVFDKLSLALFQAIHEKKQALNTEEAIMKVFTENGVSEEDFKKTFSSFAVDSKVRKANGKTVAYGITSVPNIIVNGKYRLSPDKTKGFENMIKITNFLAEKEWKAMAASQATQPAATPAPEQPQPLAPVPAIVPKAPSR